MTLRFRRSLAPLLMAAWCVVAVGGVGAAARGDAAAAVSGEAHRGASATIATAESEGSPLRPAGFGGVPAERAFRLPASTNPDAPFTYRLLVVLVEFSDVRADRTPESIHESLFDDVRPGLTTYWHEASGGRLRVEGTVTRWLRLPETYAYYTSDGAGNGGSGIDPNAYPNNAQRLVEEALSRLGDGYDGARFDNTGDGVLDGLLVLHAGPGLAETGGATGDPRLTLRAHQYRIREERSLRGTPAFDYALAAASAGHGILAHEMGHLMGLIDLYDTGLFAGASGPFGLGDWSLMATGALIGGAGTPSGLDADSRIRLGFVEPIDTGVGDAARVMAFLPGDRRVFRFPAGDDPREYFLVEARRRISIDAALPGEGLLIYHVDERRQSNSALGHYRVSLEQADGRNDLGRLGGNRGDAGDAWPGPDDAATRFDDASMPNSRRYDEGSSHLELTDIHWNGNEVVATAALRPPIHLELTAFGFAIHASGNGDERLDPGERAHVLFDLCNRGTTGGFDLIVVTLEAGPNVAPLLVESPAYGHFQLLPPGECSRYEGYVEFTFRPEASIPDAADFVLTLTDADGAPLHRRDLVFALRPGGGGTLRADEDEPVFVPRTLQGTGSAWSRTTTRFRSAPAAWHLGPAGSGTAYSAGVDAVYESPAFLMPESNPRLTLWSAIEAETLSTGRAWDGGRLEILAGHDDWRASILGPDTPPRDARIGPAPEDWQPVEPAGGYPHRLEIGSGNPLAGERVFSGNSGGFVRHLFDLSAYAGRAVRLRFRFASDAFTAPDQEQGGWWIDDLVVESGMAPPFVEAIALGDSVRMIVIPPAGLTQSWLIERRAPGEDAVRKTLVPASPVPPRTGDLFEIVSRPPPGTWIYSVRPIEADGPGLETSAAPVTVTRAAPRTRVALFSSPYRLDGPPLTVEYSVPGTGGGAAVPSRAELFDAAGRLVTRLLDEDLVPGVTTRTWSPRTMNRALAPGVYFVRFAAGNEAPATTRLVVTR